MDASGSTSIVSSDCTKPELFIVCKELYTLIRPLKTMQLITTFDEVMDGLKVYISKNKLFNPIDPARIYCENDKLGKVLGIPEFTIFEVRNILQKYISPFSGKDSPGTFTTSFLTTSPAKRKTDENYDFDNIKKPCISSPTRGIHPPSPMFLQIPNSPVHHLTDSCESIQGYETVFVKDTSDDPWSDDSKDFSPVENIVAVEETFDLEYEVESDSSCSKSDYFDSDTDSDVEDVLKTAIITFICRTDSDMEFWADNSSEDEYNSDVELTKSDQWKCNWCGTLNKAPTGCCLKCWEQRKEWLQYEERPLSKRKHSKKEKRSKKENPTCRGRQAECVKIEEVETFLEEKKKLTANKLLFLTEAY